MPLPDLPTEEFDPQILQFSEDGLTQATIPPPPHRAELAELAMRSNYSKLRKLAVILAQRQLEAQRLYEPMDHVDAFHACTARERILRGSNRSGKTLGAAVEFSRAVTGQDPYRKYPLKDGRAFIVGKDGKHNSEVLYRKLFRPGAFKILQDDQTGLWRSWRPWIPADAERIKDIVDAPPLIPPRFIKEEAWENKKELLPNVVRLTNGWEMRFYSSLAKPPQGSDVDYVWFDEEIVDPEWYSEVAARGTVDRNGLFVWSATAQKGGAQLYDLCQEAEKQRELDEPPRVQEFFAHIDDNRYFSNDQRETFFSKLTEEERRIRIEGEFAFTSFRVYPEFNWSTHGTEWFDIPKDWTRYLVVDPGRQVGAVLFVAVPPPTDERDGHIYFYDELYIKNCNSEAFAEKVHFKTREQHFYAFIIDHRGGRVRQDSGASIEWQYGEALKKWGVSSQVTGSGFIWASDDVDGGINAFRNWLVVRPDGRPILKAFKDKLPNFDHEISRYHYKRDKNRLTDKPEQRNNHLMDCARYAAMFEPKWHEVPKGSRSKDGAWGAFKAKLQRAQNKDGKGYISLGPSLRD